jgi:anti-sigma factor RsiW
VTHATPARDHGSWEDRIIEALDGRAGPAALEELERHLVACGRCRAAREEYRALLAGLRAAPAEDPPAAFWDELAGSIEARLDAAAATPVGTVRPGPGPRRFVVGGVLAAACLAVAILGALYLTVPRGGPSPQAFTSAPPQSSTGLAEAPAGSGAVEPGSRDAGSGPADAGPGADAVDAELVEEALAQLAPSAEPRDPLAVLADPDPLLDSLTPEEAAELLDQLEAQT